MKKLLNKLAKFPEIIGFTLFMVLLGLIAIANTDFSLIWRLGGMVSFIIGGLFFTLFQIRNNIIRKYNRRMKVLREMKDDIYEEQIKELILVKDWDGVKHRCNVMKDKQTKSFYCGYLKANGVKVDDLVIKYQTKK